MKGGLCTRRSTSVDAHILDLRVFAESTTSEHNQREEPPLELSPRQGYWYVVSEQRGCSYDRCLLVCDSLSYKVASRLVTRTEESIIHASESHWNVKRRVKAKFIYNRDPPLGAAS